MEARVQRRLVRLRQRGEGDGAPPAAPPEAAFPDDLLADTRAEMEAARMRFPPPSHPSPYAYFPPHPSRT